MMSVVNFEQQEERSAPEETEREPQPPPADNSGEDEEQQSALEEFPIECLPPILANMAKAISELGRWPAAADRAPRARGRQRHLWAGDPGQVL